MNTIKRFDQWWFPSHEQHMLEWMTQHNVRVQGRLTYQWSKIEAALSYVKRFNVAVDVGAHIGLWSYFLAQRFAAVHSFEPVALHRQCFEENVAAKNIILYSCALGEIDGSIALSVPGGSSGGTHVDVGGAEKSRIERLDSFDLGALDFLKLDCEGYELFALRGGEETIKRFHPVIIVEQKPGRAQKYGLGQTDAVDYLRSLGYAMRREISGDFIMTCDAEG